MSEIVRAALKRMRDEPAAVVFFVDALLGLALAFGVELSPQQIGAVMTAVAAGLWLFLRARVAPMTKVGDLFDEVERLRAIVPPELRAPGSGAQDAQGPQGDGKSGVRRSGPQRTF